MNVVCLYYCKTALSNNPITASVYRVNLDSDRTYYGFVKTLTSDASIFNGYITVGST